MTRIMCSKMLAGSLATVQKAISLCWVIRWNILARVRGEAGGHSDLKNFICHPLTFVQELSLRCLFVN
jgi:hypothetical protein